MATAPENGCFYTANRPNAYGAGQRISNQTLMAGGFCGIGAAAAAKRERGKSGFGTSGNIFFRLVRMYADDAVCKCDYDAVGTSRRT